MAKTKDVFLIREGKDRNYWTKTGVAFENKDGSLNVRLDLFPQLQFQIRDKKEKAPKK
jgi:hypothetical protein